jgi:tetratricopeptide (TPR) repeat protein
VESIDSGRRLILLKLYLRRGAACTQLGSFSEALEDYTQALEHLKLFSSSTGSDSEPIPSSLNSVAIESDKNRLEKLVAAEELKKQADNLFGEKSVELAIQKYTQALSIVPCHVSCLSNRSACYFAIGDLQSCISDCSAALQLMETSSGDVKIGNIEQITMVTALVPPVGTEKRKTWILKTLARRGAAFVQLGELKSAARDYGSAVAIDPSNEALKSDLNKLTTMASQ